jgi:formate/nitrite transporter FocA (FNT family)/protein-disulfide isomerase
MPDKELESRLNQSRSGAPAAGEAIRDMFSTDEIFHRIVATADEDFSRSTRLLFLSGIAAGLSIGLSFVARAALSGAVPEDTSGLIGNILYPLGFILIVGGKYQLFTENTLTPVTHVLTRIASIPDLFRIWGSVLFANVVGAGALAFVLANTNILTPEAAEAARQFGSHALEVPWNDLFWKGVLAGWIVASMVWLTHAVRDSTTRFLIVFSLMYLIPSADLFHCIIGACEVLYMIFLGLADLQQFAYFFSAVTIGNTMGGVLLVAILNYSQTRQEKFPDRDCGQLELGWSEWLFGKTSKFAAFFSPDREIEAQLTETDFSLDPRPNDHIKGPKDASVSIIHYGDYECPTSFEIYNVVSESMQEFDASIQFIFRHLPLSRRHPHAEHAAIAAEIAADSNKFWEMHDLLFEQKHNLEDANLKQMAKKLELDEDSFSQKMDEQSYLEKVRADRITGVRNGINTTNNLIINGELILGELSSQNLKSVISKKIL